MYRRVSRCQCRMITMWFLFHYFCRKENRNVGALLLLCPLYTWTHTICQTYCVQLFCLPVASSFIRRGKGMQNLLFVLRCGESGENKPSKKCKQTLCADVMVPPGTLDFGNCGSSLYFVGLWFPRGTTEAGNSCILGAHEDPSSSRTFLDLHRDVLFASSLLC